MRGDGNSLDGASWGDSTNCLMLDGQWLEAGLLEAGTWLYEDGGFKLYYKNFTNLKKELEPTDIIAYPMD